MFKKLFGQGSGGPSAAPKKDIAPKSTHSTVDAIQKLGETEDLLIKRRNLLEKKIVQETEKARESTRSKNKRAALMALKKKKLYEAQLEQIENNILRVSEQQMMLENQRTTVETMSALRYGAHASKQTMSDMQVEDVDEVLDAIKDQTDQMTQVQEVMAQPLGQAAELDDDDLLKELEDLEAEELDNQLLEPAPVPATKVPARQHAGQAATARPQANAPLPAAPQHRAKQKTAEELELEALEAEMAL